MAQQPISLPAGIFTNDDSPLDGKYFNRFTALPYGSVHEVINVLPKAIRNIGLTVNVLGEEYWFKNGIEDGNLKKKNSEKDDNGLIQIVGYKYEDETLSKWADFKPLEGIKNIPDKIMQSQGLAKVIFPDSVLSIGDSAFQNNSLTEVTLPDSLTSIGDYAFEGNPLTELTLPDNLTIGVSPFRIVTLENITINSDNIYSYNALFENGFNLSNIISIKVPSNVVSDYKTADGWSDYANKITAI